VDFVSSQGVVMAACDVIAEDVLATAATDGCGPLVATAAAKVAADVACRRPTGTDTVFEYASAERSSAGRDSAESTHGVGLRFDLVGEAAPGNTDLGFCGDCSPTQVLPRDILSVGSDSMFAGASALDVLPEGAPGVGNMLLPGDPSQAVDIVGRAPNEKAAFPLEGSIAVGDLPRGVATPTSAGSTVQCHSDAACRKAAIETLIARKRNVARLEAEGRRAAEDAATERWSGLSISGRCVRQAKWDQLMRGKRLLTISELSSATTDVRSSWRRGPRGGRPQGGGSGSGSPDVVVIGVLCAPPSHPRVSNTGEMCALWTLTDLHKSEPRQATLVLVGRAMDHWAHKDGLGGGFAVVGAILGVLNPTLGGRGGGLRVSIETQVLKLGVCPSLAFCTARNGDGLECRAPYNSEGDGGYCAHHARMSYAERQRDTGLARHRNRKRQHSHCTLASTSAKESHPRAGQGSTDASSRPLPSPIRRPPTLTGAPGKYMAASRAAIERAGLELDAAFAICGAARRPAIIEVLRSLEVMEGIDGMLLRQSGLYERVGVLACSETEATSAAAKRLRRKWRALLGDAVVDAVCGEGVCAPLPASGSVCRAGRAAAVHT